MICLVFVTPGSLWQGKLKVNKCLRWFSHSEGIKTGNISAERTGMRERWTVQGTPFIRHRAGRTTRKKVQRMVCRQTRRFPQIRTAQGQYAYWLHTNTFPLKLYRQAPCRSGAPYQNRRSASLSGFLKECKIAGKPWQSVIQGNVPSAKTLRVVCLYQEYGDRSLPCAAFIFGNMRRNWSCMTAQKKCCAGQRSITVLLI